MNTEDIKSAIENYTKLTVYDDYIKNTTMLFTQLCNYITESFEKA